MTPGDRVRLFHRLHERPGLLILPNAWDVMTARAFESAGFPAVGTTSFGIARAHGLRDGDNVAWDDTLATVRRMAAALAVPLSVDMEAGFSDTPATVARYARALVAAGAVGLNVEDARPDGSLADVHRQCEKIAAAKESGAFVNARSDVFWLDPQAGPRGLAAALERASAYVRAGADGIFLPGLADPELIGRAAAALEAPLNVLALPRTPPVAALRALGVRRLSLGSGPARACLGLLRRMSEELRARGTYGYLSGAVPYGEANRP